MPLWGPTQLARGGRECRVLFFQLRTLPLPHRIVALTSLFGRSAGLILIAFSRWYVSWTRDIRCTRAWLSFIQTSKLSLISSYSHSHMSMQSQHATDLLRINERQLNDVVLYISLKIQKKLTNAYFDLMATL